MRCSTDNAANSAASSVIAPPQKKFLRNASKLLCNIATSPEILRRETSSKPKTVDNRSLLRWTYVPAYHESRRALVIDRHLNFSVTNSPSIRHLRTKAERPSTQAAANKRIPFDFREAKNSSACIPAQDARRPSSPSSMENFGDFVQQLCSAKCCFPATCKFAITEIITAASKSSGWPSFAACCPDTCR